MLSPYGYLTINLYSPNLSCASGFSAPPPNLYAWFFPTANILPHDQIYPMYGVYSVKIIINQNKYNGIVNFGERPTVNGKKLLLEAHLFDFDEDIYGKHLTVEFLTFIRGEKKFDNFSLLVEQIKKDIQIAKHYHLKN